MGLFATLTGNAGVVSQEDLTKDFGKILTEGEVMELGFKLIPDTIIFTSKRLIMVNMQGSTGAKTEYLSIGYRSISRFSIETAGNFEPDAELKIWIGSENTPGVIKRFSGLVDVYDVQKVLALHVMK